MSKKKLVVIGLGVAGVTAVSELAKAKGDALLDIVVVDKRTFFDSHPANPRVAVKPNSNKVHPSYFPYSAIPGLKVATFKQASVTNITDSTVALDNGEQLSYDYLIVATGSNYASGAFAAPVNAATVEERDAEVQGTAEQVKNAKGIVVVGGGPQGVELMAEIATAYAGKNLTLVHSGPRLLDMAAEKMSKHAQKFLESHGVKVLLNDRVDSPQGGQATTKGGQTLAADLVIMATGGKPNTEWLRPTVLGSALDARGYVQVEPSLQVKGLPKVLALGDCNDVAETKLAYYAGLQGAVAAKNILAFVKGAKPSHYAASNGGQKAMFVTLGEADGTGMLGGCACVKWPVTMLKSKDMMAGLTRKGMGVKLP